MLRWGRTYNPKNKYKLFDDDHLKELDLEELK